MGLDQSATDGDIRKYFMEYGDVEHVHGEGTDSQFTVYVGFADCLRDLAIRRVMGHGESQQVIRGQPNAKLDVVKLPKPEGKPGSEREATEQRIQSTLDLDEILVGLYGIFIEERFGSGWSSRRAELRDWIAKKGGRAVPAAPVAEVTATPMKANRVMVVGRPSACPRI